MSQTAIDAATRRLAQALDALEAMADSGAEPGNCVVIGDTGWDNVNADALTFRDASGASVRYNTGQLPKANQLWSPRVGFNWDVNGKRDTQVRGGTGVFTGKPAYVWISNQVGNTGVLTGFSQLDNTTARPFTPNTDAYKQIGRAHV